MASRRRCWASCSRWQMSRPCCGYAGAAEAPWSTTGFPGSLLPYLADLDRYVDELGEPTRQGCERGQLRGGVSRVDRGQAERLCEERVVVVDVPGHVGVGSGGCHLRNKGTPRSPEGGDPLDAPSRVRDEPRRKAQCARDVFAQRFGSDGLGQGPESPVAAVLGRSLDGIDVQCDLFVRMGRGGGFRGAAGEVASDDGFDSDLVNLLQPAAFSEVGVRLVAASERAGAPGPERAFGVIPDHASTGLR